MSALSPWPPPPEGLAFSPSYDGFLAFLTARLASVAVEAGDVAPLLPEALARVRASFALTRNKYYRDGASRTPRVLVGHYSQCVLIFHHLARRAFLAGREDLAHRLYFLNTSQSSCDIHHEIELPARVYCDHPLGAVIGRGEFGPSASLAFADGCGVGNNWGHYPRIEGDLIMTSRSAVIGRTIIRGAVVLGRGATLVDAGVVENCLVVGQGRDLRMKPLDPERFAELSPFLER